MSFTGRERSSSLFIISEGQFYSKPSLKLERLEKEYSDLKRKENEDEIELRRLRTENLLLKERIYILEKESATLADKMVQDKVAWAQEMEQLYAVRTRLSITLRQLRESQSQLHDAENTVEELSKKNQICTDQIRRVGNNNLELKKRQEELQQHKKVLQAHINSLTRKLDDTESTRKEEAIVARIQDAERKQQLAELRRKIAEIDIQNVEKLAMGQLRNQTHCYLLQTSSCGLHNQQPIQHQRMPGRCEHHEHEEITDSQQTDSTQSLAHCQYAGNSDDEFDALIKDSANLERTLSDIIEGRHNTSTNVTHDAEDGVLSGSRDVLLETSISNTRDCLPVPVSACRDTNISLQAVAFDCASRQFTGEKRIGGTNIDDVSDGEIVGIANVYDNTGDRLADVADDGGSICIDNNIVGIVNDDSDDISSIDGKIVGVATVDEGDDISNINCKIIGVTSIAYADDKTSVEDANFDDLLHENVGGVGNVGCADDTIDGRTVGLANDAITDKEIVGAENDDITDQKSDDLSSFDDINDKKIDDASNHNTTDDHILSISNNKIAEKKIADVDKYVTNETIVGVAHVCDSRDEKVASDANTFSFDTTQFENIFQRVGEMEHDDVVYVSPGSSGAVMSLFGYKGEATLMLKESTV
ncbi:hypothetical protein BsWGS_09060 [Bradybaena similaris]